jgi:hypothetical protein
MTNFPENHNGKVSLQPGESGEFLVERTTPIILPEISGDVHYEGIPVTALKTADSPLSVEVIREEIDNIHIQAETADTPLLQPASAEKARKPDFRIRPADMTDIDAIVDVDMRSFGSVYKTYGKGEAELRTELKEKFSGRLNMVGSEWMPVLECDGKIVGFMTSCPTNKTPEEFESWEETTDNGTLNSTYDPDGKNVYVVTLSVLPEGSEGKDMLFADQIGKLLRKGYSLSFFESRLPGLRQWVLDNKYDGSEDALEDLNDEQKDDYANEYFEQFTEIKGKKVHQDRLIRMYERVGCQCLKVIPNAYEDEPSMNYGVMCVYDGSSLFDGSTLPVKLPQNRLTRWTFGALMQSIAHSSKLTRKIFG